MLWYADKIGPVIQSLKQKLLADSTMNSQLYHMTHIDNLSSILRDGLYSHNSVRSAFDISDGGVNRKREVQSLFTNDLFMIMFLCISM